MKNKLEYLNGTIDFFLKGQYGIITGVDGKEYFFGKKALSGRVKLVHGDTVRYTIDRKHPLLALKVYPVVARNKVINAVQKKGYHMSSEKQNKWTIGVNHNGSQKILKEHMTLSQVNEWVKTAKKLSNEEKNEILQKEENE